MFEKTWLRLKEHPKRDKILMGLGVIALTVASLWLSQGPGREEDHGPGSDEIGTVIPMGQLVIPLELANAQTLASLVHQHAVIDVYLPKTTKPVIENLKIIKLAHEGGPLFGALVPQKDAGRLQDLFSKPTLRAAVRPDNSGSTVIHALSMGRSLVETFAVED